MLEQTDLVVEPAATPLGDDDPLAPTQPQPRLRRRRLRRFVRNVPAMTALLFIVVVTVLAVFAKVIGPYEASKNDLLHRYVKPFTDGHLLGTDQLGRDIFSNITLAARWSLLTGFGAVAVALLVAVPLGLLAGYVGGWVDSVIMAGVNVILSIPPLILVFGVAGILGASLRNTIIALGLLFTPVFLRLLRGEVRNMRAGQLVEAESAMGVPSSYIMWRHILPNVASPIIVQASLTVGFGILAESGLSIVGLGPRPPNKSWGSMLQAFFANSNLALHPWMVFIPGLAIALTVLAFNILGDGLRDALGKVEY